MFAKLYSEHIKDFQVDKLSDEVFSNFHHFFKVFVK